MGFSPGDFLINAYPEELVHWEAKDRWITLWNENESKAIISITYEQATIALSQLRTAIYLATGEDPI